METHAGDLEISILSRPSMAHFFTCLDNTGNEIHSIAAAILCCSIRCIVLPRRHDLRLMRRPNHGDA
jgi:hypothetical protein